MRKGRNLQAASCIDDQDGFVVVDFRGCDSHDVSAVYQAFALLCARRKVRAALLTAGDEDADTHYALRDTLVTLRSIAGVPLRFRLALVANSNVSEKVYRTMQDELRVLGCDVRVFRAESEARQWLGGAGVIPAPQMERPECLRSRGV